MKQWIHNFAVAGLVLGAALGIVACNDDGDELTLEEYFQRVEAVADESDQSVSALFEGITDEGDMQQSVTPLQESGRFSMRPPTISRRSMPLQKCRTSTTRRLKR